MTFARKFAREGVINVWTQKLKNEIMVQIIMAVNEIYLTA